METLKMPINASLMKASSIFTLSTIYQSNSLLEKSMQEKRDFEEFKIKAVPAT